jgi:hypothetical protein
MVLVVYQFIRAGVLLRQDSGVVCCQNDDEVQSQGSGDYLRKKQMICAVRMLLMRVVRILMRIPVNDLRRKSEAGYDCR